VPLPDLPAGRDWLSDVKPVRSVKVGGPVAANRLGESVMAVASYRPVTSGRLGRLGEGVIRKRLGEIVRGVPWPPNQIRTTRVRGGSQRICPSRATTRRRGPRAVAGPSREKPDSGRDGQRGRVLAMHPAVAQARRLSHESRLLRQWTHRLLREGIAARQSFLESMARSRDVLADSHVLKARGSR
jgi:hypothetical protein